MRFAPPSRMRLTIAATRSASSLARSLRDTHIGRAMHAAPARSSRNAPIDMMVNAHRSTTIHPQPRILSATSDAVRLRLPTCFAMPWNSLRMYPGEVVLKRLTAVGGKALPDVRRAGVLRQVPERKRRLPGAVRPRDDMAYRFRLFNHSFDIIPNPQRMRRAIWYNNINQRRDVQ